MRRLVVVGGVLLMLASVETAYSGPLTTGAWPVSAGTWAEVYGPGGAGQPGSLILGFASDGIWGMVNLAIPPGGGPTTAWNGTVATFTTTYQDDGRNPQLCLGNGPWGQSQCFNDQLVATVVASLDFADPSNPVYLGGTILGKGFNPDGYAQFYAVLIRQGVIAPGGTLGSIQFPDGGHWGVAQDVWVATGTQVPEPATLLLVTTALAGAYRLRRNR
jgi:hypothetical protein